jgi:hypothetical protein
MTDLRDAARQALEALETVFMPHHPAVIALREALAEEALQRLTDANQEIEAVLEQPEKEPVAWMDPNRGEVCRAHWLESHAPERDVDRFSCPLYIHPPRREWRGLTEEEMVALAGGELTRDERMIARAIEAALKERNA